MPFSSVKRVVSDSKLLIIAGSSYFVISFLFSQITLTNHNIYYNNYSNFPFGILSGLFLYDGWPNMLSFVTGIILFGISSIRYDQKTVRTRATFSIAAMFLIGLLANLYWVLMYPSLSAYGQSGVMFALNGIVLIFCTFNVGPLFVDFKQGLRNLKGESLRNFLASVMSVIMVAFILYYVVFFKAAFLNENAGVAFPIHAISFVLGVVFTVFFDLAIINRKGKQSELTVS